MPSLTIYFLYARPPRRPTLARLYGRAAALIQATLSPFVGWRASSCRMAARLEVVLPTKAALLAQPALHRACDDVVDLAEAYFIDAENALPASPRWVALAAKAMLIGYRALLAGLRARGWTRLDGPVHCPVWSRPALKIGDMLILR